jgi:hypothetical protein
MMTAQAEAWLQSEGGPAEAGLYVHFLISTAAGDCEPAAP